MASDVLFEVNASQILAKLHLAGLQPLKGYDKNVAFVVNTGIKNDDINAKPDNPGKVEFDLKNSSGEYEVGFVTEITYHKPFDNTSDGNANNKGNTQNLSDASSKLDEISGIIADITNKKIDIKTDKDQEKKLEDLKANVYKILKTDKSKMPLDTLDDIEKAKKTYNIDSSDDEEEETDDSDDVESDTSKDANVNAGYENAVNAAKTTAIEILIQYMTHFAGADKVKNITNDNVDMIWISPNVKDSNSPQLVKMFEIVGISDAEKGKLNAEFAAKYKKDPKKDNCVHKICFKIKYDLELDK